MCQTTRPHRAGDVRFISNSVRTLAPQRNDAKCRFCCKSLFALVIKIFPGCRRDFRVKMWGTSSPDDKLTGDLGNVIESTKIGGRRSDRLMAGKLSPSNFGLLQHNLPVADSCTAASASLFNHLVGSRKQSFQGMRPATPRHYPLSPRRGGSAGCQARSRAAILSLSHLCPGSSWLRACQNIANSSLGTGRGRS
jgi:hypothetical protein